MKKGMVCIAVMVFLCLFALTQPRIICEAAENSFEGKGTVQEPYLINTAEDILNLCESVNMGTSASDMYLNSYFRQTADIDLKEYDNWTAIGKIGSNTGFLGTYDGNGYSILNLNICENQSAFFGYLDGTVMNLGIESGAITGDYSGGIAVTTSARARIVNCYSKIGNPNAAHVGSISYDFNGTMVNSCSVLAESDTATYGFCYSGFGTILNSCSTTGDLADKELFSGELDSCSQADELMLAERLNGSLIDSAKRSGIEIEKFFMWNTEHTINQDEPFRWSIRKLSLMNQYFVDGSWLIKGMIAVLACWIGFSIYRIYKGVKTNWVEKSGDKVRWNVDWHGWPKIEINRKTAAFIGLMAIGYLIYWSSIRISNGETLTNYFLFDIHNTFMDFFNPIVKAPELTYQAPNYSNYPALANVMFAVIRNFVPKGLQIDGNMMRGSIFANMWFIICSVISILALYGILRSILSREAVKAKPLVWIILFSGPFLFLYERGNNLIITVVLVAFFIRFYRDENKILQEIALLALAMATALKIYPVLFGALLLKKGNWKKIFRAIDYGIICMIVPFFYYDGFKSFFYFLSNVVSRNSAIRSRGLGYNFSFSTVERLVYQAATGEYLENVIWAWYAIPIGICIVLFLLAKEEWKKILAVCLFMIWVPNESYTYMLCFLCIPLILFLGEKAGKLDWVYLICFIGTFSLYSLGEIDKLNVFDSSYPISWGMVIIHAAVWILAATALFEELYRFTRRYNIREVIVKGEEK